MVIHAVRLLLLSRMEGGKHSPAVAIPDLGIFTASPQFEIRFLHHPEVFPSPELLDLLQKAGIPAPDVHRVLRKSVQWIRQHLSENQPLHLPGWGHFLRVGEQIFLLEGETLLPEEASRVSEIPAIPLSALPVSRRQTRSFRGFSLVLGGIVLGFGLLFVYQLGQVMGWFPDVFARWLGNNHMELVESSSRENPFLHLPVDSLEALLSQLEGSLPDTTPLTSDHPGGLPSEELSGNLSDTPGGFRDSLMIAHHTPDETKTIRSSAEGYFVILGSVSDSLQAVKWIRRHLRFLPHTDSLWVLLRGGGESRRVRVGWGPYPDRETAWNEAQKLRRHFPGAWVYPGAGIREATWFEEH